MAADVLDYIVSFVVFLGIMTAMVTATCNNLNNVYTYQGSQQVSVAASNLLNNIVESTGTPAFWGLSSVAPTSFGLRWPDATSNMVSPFAPMRMMSSAITATYQGTAYHGFSINGTNIYIKNSDSVTYAQASQIMNVSGQYGWNLAYTPLINVDVIPEPYTQGVDFKALVTVKGETGPINNAAVNATLIYSSGGSPYPNYAQFTTVAAKTNSTGIAILDFPGFTSSVSYVLFVRATFSGLSGAGFHIEPQIIPPQPIGVLVSDYGNGVLTLVDSADIIPGYTFSDTIYYNATFVQPVGVLGYQKVLLSNPTGTISPGVFGTLSLGGSTNNPGILLVFYKTAGGVFGVTATPWGITPLNLAATFGGNPKDAQSIMVKTETVNINRFSYQLRLQLWKLET